MNQFGQGIRSLADMLDEFTHLEADQQRHRFVFLYCRLGGSTWHNGDVEQALADCELDDPEGMYGYLNLRQFTPKPRALISIPHSASPPDGRLDQAYKVLLTLFKLDYQRRFTLEENPTSWHQDLSDPKIVQRILTEYRALVERVYANPSYRSEFTCLAKVQRDDELRLKTPDPEPTDTPETHFDFLTYDELVMKGVAQFAISGPNRGLFLLRQSLSKALAKQHQLSDEQVNRLVVDVIDRYLRGM